MTKIGWAPVAFCSILLLSALPAAAQQALYTDGALSAGIAPAPAATPTGVALADIDKKVSPCANFYQYACGNWMATHTIPADQSAWGTFSELAERNREELHGILEKIAANDPHRDALQTQVGNYYAACMDTSRIDALGAKPLQPEMAAIAAVRTRAELAAEVARLQMVGVDVMFSFGSDQDYKDATQRIAEVDQGGLGLPDRDYYLGTDANTAAVRRQYQEHVARMFELLGDSAATAANEAREVLQIETALAQASLSDTARRAPENVYHKMTRAQFLALAPQFDWNTFFADAGAPAFASLNVAAPDFFKPLGSQLTSVPLPAWKVYLRWQLVNTAAPTLSQPFVDADFDFFGKVLSGRQVNSDRWKRCVTDTDRDLGEALGQLYVQQEFGPQAKQKMLAMVNELQQSLAQDIRTVPWMDEATKKAALVKLAAFTRKIGYPDRWRDYSALAISRDDFFGNVQRSAAFEWHRDLNKIGKPVDRSEWEMTPPTVNAYYQPEFNEIVFPAGILQPPFYDPNRDMAVNFGAIGMVMGHEMTHGFDDQGRQFDAQGNLRNWWSKNDAEQFAKRAACIADEYSKFSPLPGVKVNGQLTEGENIADNGGARLAYNAMMTALDGKVNETLDGYTAPQRFFLGFAQIWCENVRPAQVRLLATVDPHSPPEFRVNGVVTNMPQFAQAFHCGPHDAMTAQPNACRVW